MRRSARRVGPGFTVFEALIRDASGMISAVWFNQRYLKDVFAPGQRVVLYGPIEARGLNGVQFSNPSYEFVEPERPLTRAGCTPGASSPSTSALAASPRSCSVRWCTARSNGCRRGRTPCPLDIRERLGLPPRDDGGARGALPAARQ